MRDVSIKTDEKVPIILLAMEDITKRKELEDMLREYATSLNSEVIRKVMELEVRVQELEITKSKSNIVG